MHFAMAGSGREMGTAEFDYVLQKLAFFDVLLGMK